MLSISPGNISTKPVRVGRRPSVRKPRLEASLAIAISLTVVGLALTGCGKGSSTGVSANAIQMTNANGLTTPAVALSIGSKLNLAMIPSNDVANAGIDWTVTCLGNPITGSFTNGSCGTLSPAHTVDGGTTEFTAPSATPIGTTVTVAATVTSNPSQSSEATFTILPSPIALSFNGGVSSAIAINTSTQITVQTSNDPLNAGVIWTVSCGSGSCGSFNPATGTGNHVSTVYTAPSALPTGNTVTITATSLTDTTKSVSATVTVTGPPPPPPPPASIAVIVVPTAEYVQRTGPSRSVSLTAIVSNDSTSAGVDWTLSCSTSNCGTISTHTRSGDTSTFQNNSTVPVGGTITITAKSTADATKSSTATATVVSSPAVAVTFTSAPPASLNTTSQVTLAASASPGSDGINWTATCGTPGACGTFSPSPAHTSNNGQITYTAPATVPSGGLVAITASFAGTTPSNPIFMATTIVQSPPPVPTLSFTSPPPASLVSATQLSVAVSVANDAMPGGVTWNAQCGNTTPGGCGWFAQTKTASGATTVYTSPPVTSTGTTVTLTATSIADPSVSISSSPIAINPDTTLRVNFVPYLPSGLQTSTTVSLNAAVANDPTHAGVDWRVCPSGCGFFTIRPAVPEILQTSTTPYVPASPAVTATTVSAWPNGLPIPYTAPSQVPSSGSVAVVASAHTDPSTANSGAIAISTVSEGPALNGVVMVGSQPVAGASVVLYAAGVQGYASASTKLATSSPSDSSGSFSVPAGYTCLQPNSQMYLVATGGNIGTADANPNRALMTALGSCSNLSSTSVVVNEVTTIASAVALASFASDDALTGNSSPLYLGSSSGNLVGLANAFAAVNNLVDISSGKVRFTVPAENASVPYVEINSLADILNACTATAGGVEGDGSACGTLFAATNLLGTGTYPSSIAPSETLQAAFNIAQHPVTNYNYHLGSLSGIATVASPFQPILTTSPSDWSVSLNYTSGGGLSSAGAVSSLAVDGTGNLWITDTKSDNVIEWNTTGAAISPSTGFPAVGGPIAIDATGNIWISGDGALTELSSLGSPLPWSPFGGVSGGGTDLAFDAQSNLWVSNQNGISEFSNLGIQLSPVNGFTVDGLSNFTAVTVDSSNNVWAGTGPISQSTSGLIVELTNPGAQFITSASPGSFAAQMAPDSAGDVWFDSDQVCEATPYAGKGSTLFPNCYPNAASGPQGFKILAPRGIALDGAGIVWIASQGGGNPITAPSVFPLEQSAGPTSSTNSYVSQSLAAGPLRVAIDGSGNIWVLLADNTVTEYVGAATPVVTPLALGVKNKQIGAKP